MLLESFLTLAQPKPEFIERLTNSFLIFSELRTNREDLLKVQATQPATPRRTQTIEIPEGYVLCPNGYVCIPKDQYNSQPIVASTVNQAPQSTITNPTASINQPPSQSINQINQNVNPGIGQINSQQNGVRGGVYPNQGINPSIGQPGGIGINQQNIGGFNNGVNERGRIKTNINLNIGVGVSF